MLKLHSSFWHRNRKLNEQDGTYCEKSSMIGGWVQPEQIGLPDAAKTTNVPMWGVSAKLLRKMELARTPLAKQRYLDAAIEAVCYSYSLSFPGRETEKKAD